MKTSFQNLNTISDSYSFQPNLFSDLQSVLLKHKVRVEAHSGFKPSATALTDNNIIEKLRTQIEVLSSLDVGFDFRSFFWVLCKRQNWIFNSKLIHNFAESDVVEVYLLDGTQFIANLNFFRFISYTLEEIYTGDFRNLYKRPSLVIDEIMRASHALISGSATDMVSFANQKPFWCREVKSSMMLEALIKQKFISALRGPEGQIEAIVSCYEVLESMPQALGLRKINA